MNRLLNLTEEEYFERTRRDYDKISRANYDLTNRNKLDNDIVKNINNNIKLEKYLNGEYNTSEFGFGEEKFDYKEKIQLPILANHENMLSNIKMLKSFDCEPTNIDILIKPSDHISIILTHFFRNDEMKLYNNLEDHIVEFYENSTTHNLVTDTKTIPTSFLEQYGLSRDLDSVYNKEERVKRKLFKRR